MIKGIKFSFFFIVIIFLNGCKCHYYYSNDRKSAIIQEDLFEMEVRINSQIRSEDDQLEIAIHFKDSLASKIPKSSLKIYSIDVDKKYLLVFINEYASHYYFGLNKKWPGKIDIGLTFDIDSSGLIYHKSIILKNLIQYKDCEFRPVMH